MTRLVLAILAVATLSEQGRAQVMSVSSSSITLSPPDTVVYGTGVSAPGAVSVMVSTCAGALGCRLTIENPNLASIPPVDLQWRLVSVAQVGSGDLGCTALAPLLSWQPLPAGPVSIMDTGVVNVPGTACTATLELRASGVRYSTHQFTSPASTYWRDAVLRTVEK